MAGGKLGKVVKSVSNRDELIRSAKVLLSSERIVGRPLDLLCPIEVSENGKKACEQ